MWGLVIAASLGLLALNFRDYPPGNGRDEINHLRVIEFYYDAHRSPVLPDDLARASEQGHQPPLYYVLMAGLIELGLPDPQTDAYQPNPFLLTGNYMPEIPPYNRALYVHHWAGGRDKAMPCPGGFAPKGTSFGRNPPLRKATVSLQRVYSFHQPAGTIHGSPTVNSGFFAGGATHGFVTRPSIQCADTSYIRTLYTLRGVAVLINMVGLVFVFLTMRIIFPPKDARPISLLALALLTLTPSYWRTAMVINNNHLVFLFAAISLWLLAKILREGPGLRLSIGLGVVMGLGMLSKVFFVPVVIVVGVVFLIPRAPAGINRDRAGLKPAPTGMVVGEPFMAPASFGINLVRASLSHRDFRWSQPALTENPLLVRIKHLALIMIIAALIAGWWYARNIILYDDPTAATITEQILDSRRKTPLGALEFFEIILTWPGELWLESWTVLNTRLSLWLASGIGSALMVSGLAAILRRRTNLIRGGGMLLMGAFLPAMMLAVVGAARNLHGHYSPPLMLTSLPATSILMAIGALAWIPKRLWERGAMTGVFAILAATVIFHATSFSPLFPPLERTEAVDVENPVSVQFQNGARLIGYQIEDRVLRPGVDTRVRLCWQTDAPLNELYAVTTQLVLDDGSKAAQQDGYPLSGRYPTTAWQPGTIFCEWIPLRIRADAITPRAYDLRVGMYVLGGDNVPWQNGPDTWQRVLLLDKVVIVDFESTENEIIARVDDWGALTRLDSSVKGNELTLNIGWQARRSAAGRYRYFLHALDTDGKIVAQMDREPLHGDLPTDLWTNGMAFADQLRLDIPPETARVIFGVYDPVTGERGVWTADGEMMGQSLDIRMN